MRIDDLQIDCYTIAAQHGWWDGIPRSPAELLALVHSEVSEALEEIRNGHPPREIRVVGDKPEGFPIELADIIIRVLDMAEHFGLDMEAALAAKMQYNKTRPHRHGGKRL